MRTYQFEDFVGETKTFLDESFNKRARYIPGAMAGHLQELPGVAMLDDLLALETVPPSYLRVTKDGQGVSRHAYTRVVGRGTALTEVTVPEKVYELFRLGGTLTWNSLEHVLPVVRQLLRPFAQTLACDTDAVLFVTPAGHEGFKPHYDSTDSFVLQVEGSKRWRVWETPEFRVGDWGGDASGEPEMVVTLHPGDVLYVPHGTPHEAAAEGSISVHISIGVEPRRWRDLIRAVVEAIITDDEFHEFPVLAREHDRAASARLAGMLSQVRERLADVNPEAEIRRLAEIGRMSGLPTKTREILRLSSADAIAGGSLLRRSAMPVELTGTSDAKTTVAVNGHKAALPEPLAAAVLALEPGALVTADTFYPGVSGMRSVLAAQRLTRLGVLEVAE
jgi:mannose-6-phosphate isomerase-like protein (cupin superfamily)